MLKIIPLLLTVLFLRACSANTPSTQQIAYDTIVAAKAFIDKTYSQHPECGTVAAPSATTTVVCVDLKKAEAAKNSLIDVVEVVCAGPNFNTGGACDFPAKGTPAYTQAVAKYNAALAAYNVAASDLKGVIQ